MIKKFRIVLLLFPLIISACKMDFYGDYYNPTYQGLIDLGVKPNYLSKEILQEMIHVLERYKENIDQSIITKGISW